MACARAPSNRKTEPAIVNEQIRARANKVFMNSLPCYPTSPETKDRREKKTSIDCPNACCRCHTRCRKKSRDFGAAHLGQVLLGYIAVHASTTGCVCSGAGIWGVYPSSGQKPTSRVRPVLAAQSGRSAE